MEKVLGLIGGLVATVSAISLGASILYEFGYFTVVGYSYMRIATLPDYLSNALIWVPAACITVFLSYISIVFLSKRKTVVENALIGPPLDISQPPERILQAFRAQRLRLWLSLIFILLPLLLLVIVAVPMTLWDYSARVTIVAIPAYISVIFASLAGSYLSEQLGVQYRYMPQILTIAALVALTSGGREASRSIEDNSNPIEISVSGDQVILARVMRVYDRGVLFRTVGGSQINFTPWSEVKGLGAKLPQDARIPLCIALEMPCLSEETSSPYRIRR